jgi:hypothetical protein
MSLLAVIPVTVTQLTPEKTYVGVMPMSDEKQLLELLKAELDFLENGGYRGSPRNPWRPNFVFEDSPTCINFENKAKPKPCTQCSLMAFVPANHRESKFPCRHIPLTSLGETVSSFYECGTQEELEGALRNWLQQSIHMLERGNRSRSQVA